MSMATLLAALRRKKVASLIACVVLLAVIGITLIRSMALGGSYLIVTMVHDIKTINGGSLVAMGLGLSTAMPWLFLRFPMHRVARSIKPSTSLFVLGLSLAFIAPAVAAIAYRDFRSSQRKMPYKVAPHAFDPRFSTEVVASFADGNEPEAVGAYPICVAVDENDNVFVSLQLKGEDDYSGRIFQLGGGTGVEPQDPVENCRPVPRPFRTFGLAVRGGEIFVSRSGLLLMAEGSNPDENGAITRLRDLDRDGTMDYYEDL